MKKVLLAVVVLSVMFTSCAYHEYACPAHYKITQYYSGRIHDHGPSYGR
jgi:hypothetical protein